MRFLPVNVVRLALVMAACSVFPAVAHGQSRKPVRGWFGTARTGPEEGHTLSLTGRIGETFDREQDTSYPDLQAGIRYDRRTRNRSWYFNADTSSRRLFGFEALPSVGHDAAAGFSTSLGRRTRVRLEQSFRTSPFYLVTVLPLQIPGDPTASIAAPESGSDYALFRRKTSALTSGVSVSHLLARHSSLTFDYAFERTLADEMHFSTQYVKASFSHYLGRYAVARAGYGRRIVDRHALSTANEAGVAASHDIDAGIDYNRPLSLSRRTKLTISTGSAIVPAADSALQYRFLGAAALQREIGRSWKASLDYGRNLEFVETFPKPLLSDTASLRLQGRFTRQLDLAVSASISKGSVGFATEGTDQRYDTYGGSARLRWAISRLVTGYGEYVAYGHAFGSGVEMPTGFGRDVTRSEIRVGLTVWAPLVR